MSETLSTVGEFGLIDRIHDLVRKEGVSSPGVTLGIGDDTAAFTPSPGFEMLVTCDCVVENRHYLPERISPRDLGRRSMTLNISDIGAMGGKPLYAIVSLGLKGETSVAYVEDMYRGFMDELNSFGASIIGGNLTKCADALFIDITLIGEVEKDIIIRRCTAKKGDAILVTGYPGQSAGGLYLLLASPDHEDMSSHPLVRAYNTPSHRAREGRAVAQSGKATAMIDISDGFLGDLGHICKESDVGAMLHHARLPVSKNLKKTAQELGRDPYDLFLGDSDDYELIITCAPEHTEVIRSAIAGVSEAPVNEVGEIVDASEGMSMVFPDGSKKSITPAGWDHFA